MKLFTKTAVELMAEGHSWACKSAAEKGNGTETKAENGALSCAN